MPTSKRLTGIFQSKSFNHKRVIKWLRTKTALMKEYARIVIILNNDGTIASVEVKPDFMWVGDYLTVIGPVIINGEEVPEATRLEIGITRCTPYRQFEWREGRKIKAMKDRWWFPLTQDELLPLLPTIAKELQKAVDQDARGKKRFKYTQYNKSEKGRSFSRAFFSGTTSTCLFEDDLLVYSFLLQDNALRKRVFLQNLSQEIKYRFKGLRHARYSDKQLLAHAGSKIIASKIGKYTKEQIFDIRVMLGGNSNSRNASLFDRVIESFGIKPRESLEAYEKIFLNLKEKHEEKNRNLLLSFPLEIMAQPKRDQKRSTHAQGCLRVEILPSRHVRDDHDNIVERNKKRVHSQLIGSDNEYHGKF